MLSSKVALITGAAQGIGLATARLLLKNGARVSLSIDNIIYGLSTNVASFRLRPENELHVES